MHVWWKCLFTRVQFCQCALITAATTASLAAPTDWSNFSTLTKDCSSRRTGVARTNARGQILLTYTDANISSSGHSQDVRTAVASHDNSRLASGGNDRVPMVRARPAAFSAFLIRCDLAAAGDNFLCAGLGRWYRSSYPSFKGVRHEGQLSALRAGQHAHDWRQRRSQRETTCMVARCFRI
jgi:hypothetical protein